MRLHVEICEFKQKVQVELNIFNQGFQVFRPCRTRTPTLAENETCLVRGGHKVSQQK